MRRIFVRGSNIGIRAFAVAVLTLGLVGGLIAGTHTKKADTLTALSADQAQAIDAQVEADRLDTRQLREARTDSLQEQRTAQYQAAVAQARQIAAIRQARAVTKARAVAAARKNAALAAAARAAEARRAAAARASRSADRVTTSASRGTSGGTAPAAPVDCQRYSGNKRVGCSLLAWAGFSTSQMSCLDSLWSRESGWSTTAGNQSSGAYGIPQALPGSKMGSYGSDWKTNPVTQIKWGLQYIKGRYSTPCGAWSAFQSQGWY